MHGEIEDECPEDGEAPGVRDGVEVLRFRVDGRDGPVQGWERWGCIVDGCGAAVMEMMVLTVIEDAVMKNRIDKQVVSMLSLKGWVLGKMCVCVFVWLWILLKLTSYWDGDGWCGAVAGVGAEC